MVLIGFYLSNLLAYGDCLSYVLFIIRFVLSGKGRGCEVPAFFDKIKKGRNFVPYSTPSHYRDSPRGALGTGFPRPLASLRSGRFGKKGRNFVPYSTPSHYRDSPRGALGTGFPRPLASLRSGRFGKKGRNFGSLFNPSHCVTAPGGDYNLRFL